MGLRRSRGDRQARFSSCGGSPAPRRDGRSRQTRRWSRHLSGDRGAARRGIGADTDDPAAAARPRVSTPYRSGPAHRRVPRLSRPASRTAAGARMGDTLARNAYSGAPAAGAVPPRFPHRQLHAGLRPGGRTDRRSWIGNSPAGATRTRISAGSAARAGASRGSIERRAASPTARRSTRPTRRASGRRLEPERVRFWEVLANVRWAVIALQQSDRYLIQGARDLVTAIIGRRATECDLELLMLLDPDGTREIGRTRHQVGARGRQDAGRLRIRRSDPRSAERPGPAGARTRTSAGARPAAAAAGAAPRAAARRDRDGDRRTRGRGGTTRRQG